MAASVEQLTDQVVTLNDDMKRVVNRLKLAEDEVVRLKEQLDDEPQRRRRGRRNDDDDNDELGEVDAKDPHLVDRRYFEPPKLENTSKFKEFSDDFVDYIEHRDKALGAKLRVAMKLKTAITDMGGDGISLHQVAQLYRVLKSVTLHPEARLGSTCEYAQPMGGMETTSREVRPTQ